MFQSPGPIIFSIGGFAIHWYGVFIAAGILLAFFYAISEAKRRGLDPTHISDMAFYIIVAGVIGARLYYVLFQLDYYRLNPEEIPMLWKGGLAIHGALIGGAIACALFIFRKKLKFLLYADIIIPGVILAQGIGRFGNFFNNEAFGRPTELPWKLYIPPVNRPEEFKEFSYFHPTFLYEALWDFLIFSILLFLARKLYPHAHRPVGYILFGYLILYSFGRFFIESLRVDSLYLGPLRVAQVMSVILFVSGLIGLVLVKQKNGKKLAG